MSGSDALFWLVVIAPPVGYELAMWWLGRQSELITTIIRRLGRPVAFALGLLMGHFFFCPAASGAETKPGVERWPIKTSVPAGTDLAHPTAVSYADLAAMPDPEGVARNDPRYQATRIWPFHNPLQVQEGDILSIVGWLHVVAGEPDGDYHIQISGSRESQTKCFIVEVPNPKPAFVATAALRPYFARVREFIKTKLLKDREPSSRGSVLKRPTLVRVTGQLFYDDAHVGTPPRGKQGCQAESLWELHPVTAIEFEKQKP